MKFTVNGQSNQTSNKASEHTHTCATVGLAQDHHNNLLALALTYVCTLTSPDYPAWQKVWPVVIVIFFVFTATQFVIGVALWCAVWLVVAKPPNDSKQKFYLI